MLKIKFLKVKTILSIVKSKIGSRVESEVAVILIIPNIWMMGYFRLRLVEVKECPVGDIDRREKMHRYLNFDNLVQTNIYPRGIPV